MTDEKTKTEINVYESPEDHVFVVQIDTSGMPADKHGPILRVNLNDEPVYANPPFPNTLGPNDYRSMLVRLLIEELQATGRTFAPSLAGWVADSTVLVWSGPEVSELQMLGREARTLQSFGKDREAHEGERNVDS